MVDHCRELVGVEIVPEAIESAKANAARMGDAIATKSRFFCADAGAAATRLAAEGLRPDVIVLDPPRKGCDEATLSAVALCFVNYRRLRRYFSWQGVWRRDAMAHFFKVNRDTMVINFPI